MSDRSLQPGQPFPYSAAFWNPTIQAAQDYRLSQSPQPGGNAGRYVSAQRAVEILIRNNTSSTVGRHGILKVSGIVIAPTDNELEFRDRPVFIGSAPDSASTHGIVVTLEPIKQDAIGRAIIVGLSVAQVNVTSSTHKFAKPIASNTTNFVSDAAEGFPLIWGVHTGTQPSWCAILLGSGSGATSCENLPPPGVHMVTVAGTIAPGATGPVLYGEQIIQAKNQSDCPVKIGHLAVLCISPDCEAFFTPCVCCDGSPIGCCDLFVALCIAGVIKILAVDGGTATWTLTGCCECEGATLAITLACVEGVITADWEYTCGETNVTGSLDWSELCADPPESYEDTITPDGCSILIRASTEAMECPPCEPLPPCEKCIEFGTFTPESNPGMADIGPTAIVMSKPIVCNGDVVTAAITVTNNSGGAWVDGEVYFGIQFTTSTVNLDLETVSATPALATNTSPYSGTEIAGTWTGLNLANGASQTFYVTFRMIGCTLGGLFIAGVGPGGYDSDYDFACVECPE